MPNAAALPGSSGIGRTAAHLARAVEVELVPVKLSLPQYRLLSTLDELAADEGDAMNAAASLLADRLAVSRPSVTALVDGLVARGLVSRHVDDADRRRVWHVLTPDGASALREADQLLDEFLVRLATLLPQRESKRAVSGLPLWQRALTARRGAWLQQGSMHPTVDS